MHPHPIQSSKAQSNNRAFSGAHNKATDLYHAQNAGVSPRKDTQGALGERSRMLSDWKYDMIGCEPSLKCDEEPEAQDRGDQAVG